jgi:chromosome segregation ATPase
MDTSISNNFLGSWMGIAFVAINGVVGLFAIVTFFATRREVDSIEKRVGHLETEMNAIPGRLAELERHLGERGEERLENIYERIEEVREGQARKLDEVRRELSGKIDNLPGTLISTLKQTGAIK